MGMLGRGGSEIKDFFKNVREISNMFVLECLDRNVLE